MALLLLASQYYLFFIAACPDFKLQHQMWRQQPCRDHMQLPQFREAISLWQILCLPFLSLGGSASLADSWPLADGCSAFPWEHSPHLPLSLCACDGQFSGLCFHTQDHSTCERLWRSLVGMQVGGWAGSGVLGDGGGWPLMQMSRSQAKSLEGSANFSQEEKCQMVTRNGWRLH